MKHNPNNESEWFLPDHVLNFLNSCPTAGAGLHKWTIRAAVRLHRYSADKDDIARLLRKYSEGRGREGAEREREIWDAIRDGEAWLASLRNQAEAGPRERVKAWSEHDAEKSHSIAENGPSLAEFSARSPLQVDSESVYAEEIVGALFPGNPLVCVGWATRRFRTSRLQAFQQSKLLREMQLIVPSPMSAEFGKKKSGGRSAHTLDNTGPRRFLVIEFDHSPIDEQAAILWHLGEKEPLILAVHSGGKSIHGWYFVQGREETALRGFMDDAASLGADTHTWSRSQFVRLPGGMRDNGNRQRVVYFDPERLRMEEK